MCGIAGIIGPDIHKADMEMFRDLLFVSSLRGIDSTGVAVADLGRKQKNFYVKKRTIPASAYIRADSLEKAPILEDYHADLFMGHCRDATVGSVTEANAHPFVLNNLIGMHNGTLLDAKYRGTGKTDSEAMFLDMDVRGVKPVLEELMPSSAYAIAVYHTGTTKITLARNKKRPLWIGLNLERRVISWASEESMLWLAAERHGIKIVSYYLQPDMLYEIDCAKIKKGDVVSWKGIPIEYKNTNSAMATVFVKETNSHWETMTGESYYDSIFNQDYSAANNQTLVVPEVPRVKPTVDMDKVFNTGSKVMELDDPIPFGKAEDDGPNYEAEGAHDPDYPHCCICQKELYGATLDSAECVIVDRTEYYSCLECNDEIARRSKAQADLRRPGLDPTKVGDEVTTH